MSHPDADPLFARRGDADWEMFRRGRPAADEPAWVRDDAGASTPASGSWLDAFATADDGPVPLEPADEVPSPRAGCPPVSHFFAKVVGVCFPNDDGTSRREAVRSLKPMDRVRLVHRPDNPVDANAVAVLRHPDGRQLGFLRASLAKELVAAARGGTRYLAVAHEVDGNDPLATLLSPGDPVGVLLLVLTLPPGRTKADARAYLLGLMNGRDS